jgi:iron complex transport system permease protein
MAKVGDGLSKLARDERERVLTVGPSIPTGISRVPAIIQPVAAWRIPLVLVGVTIAVLALHLCVGSQQILTLKDVAQAIVRGPNAGDAMSVMFYIIRLPRALESLFAGLLLGLVGSAFQALLRNPLADPYIVGVSSGAAVGSALAIIFGFGAFVMPAGFVSGILSLMLVMALARRKGVTDVAALLLSGVTVGALLSAVLTLILMLAGQDTNRILSFMLGHTSDSDWTKVGALGLTVVVGSALLWPKARALNAFAVGGQSAQRLGVDTARLTRFILIVGTAMTAASVGAVGIVGFVGLVAPHLARRIVGVDWRVSLPTAGLLGGLIMLLADLVAQRALPLLTGNAGMELNIGIVCALVGAPSLLGLLRRAA